MPLSPNFVRHPDDPLAALDASPLKDVHTEHCCRTHGCKYGRDLTCTVAQGYLAQSFPCETCEFVREQVATYVPEATDDEIQAEVWRRRHAKHGHVCDTEAPNCGHNPCIDHRQEIFLT